LSWIAAGDFVCRDRMLSRSVLPGAIPARFGFDARNLALAQHFELARGDAENAPMRSCYHWVSIRKPNWFAQGR